jgi:hypothetical protein
VLKLPVADDRLPTASWLNTWMRGLRLAGETGDGDRMVSIRWVVAALVLYGIASP